jgi:hypothetical protein
MKRRPRSERADAFKISRQFQQQYFICHRADELQSEGEAILREPAGNGNCRYSGEIRRSIQSQQ